MAGIGRKKIDGKIYQIQALFGGPGAEKRARKHADGIRRSLVVAQPPTGKPRKYRKVAVRVALVPPEQHREFGVYARGVNK